MSYEQLAASVDALAATNAELVQSIYDGTQLTSGVFADVATGLANTKDGQYFSVVSAENAEYLILYLNSAGVAIEKKVYPSSTAVDDVLELIRESSQASVLDITDDLGFAWGDIKEDGFNLPGMEVAPIAEEVTRMMDEDGFALWEIGEESSSFGPLTVKSTPDDGVYVLDELGFVWNNLLESDSQSVPIDPVLPSTIPILYGPICGVQGEKTSLYVRNVLTQRPAQNTVIGTITSITQPEIQTSDYELKFLTESMGASAYLYLRSELSDAERSRILMSCVSAPNPGTGSGNVLIIGDSIQNRQGAQLQKQYLEGWGYSPVFVGTLEGSAAAEDTENAGGPLGECREGWETGDFTYSITDRVSIVEPGGEAAYLALPKSSKWKINPFLRVATGSDSADIIRNGMVFDPAFYQSRFSLGTPSVVSITLGTNNVRDRSVAEIYDNAYSDITLLISQCRAAWPLAKIVLSCPGTSRDTARDVLWETKYVPYLRALIQAKKDSGSTNVIVFPAWAHMTQEAGYTIASATVKIDPLTGTATGVFGDTVHPRGAVRLELHKAYAKMLACAFTNLI